MRLCWQILVGIIMLVAMQGCLRGIVTAVILHPINVNRCRDADFRNRHKGLCDEYAPAATSPAPAKTSPAQQNNAPGEGSK